MLKQELKSQNSKPTFLFQRKYVLPTLFLLVTELLIAAFMHDRFVRPYAGDFLVVILIYCFVRCFWNAPFKIVCLSVLLFAYTVEIMQYFNLVKMLGLAQYRWANILVGNSFEWLDLVTYTLGISLVYFVEDRRSALSCEL